MYMITVWVGGSMAVITYGSRIDHLHIQAIHTLQAVLDAILCDEVCD